MLATYAIRTQRVRSFSFNFVFFIECDDKKCHSIVFEKCQMKTYHFNRDLFKPASQQPSGIYSNLKFSGFVCLYMNVEFWSTFSVFKERLHFWQRKYLSCYSYLIWLVLPKMYLDNTVDHDEAVPDQGIRQLY